MAICLLVVLGLGILVVVDLEVLELVDLGGGRHHVEPVPDGLLLEVLLGQVLEVPVRAPSAGAGMVRGCVAAVCVGNGARGVIWVGRGQGSAISASRNHIPGTSVGMTVPRTAVAGLRNSSESRHRPPPHRRQPV